MDRQNPRTNGKSKAIQTKSHKEAYIYTLTKREKGKKIYLYIKKKRKRAIIWFWMKSNFSPIPRRSLRHKLPGRVCPALKKGNKAFVTPNPSQLLTIGYLGLWVERESSQNDLAKQFLVKVNLPGKAAE